VRIASGGTPNHWRNASCASGWRASKSACSWCFCASVTPASFNRANELVLGDFLHDDFLVVVWRPAVFAGRDSGTVRCEPMIGSREILRT